MKKNIISVSIVLATTLYGGAIISNTDDGFSVNKQYGYGGLNMDNIDVKIVDIYDPHYNIGWFDESDGSYSTMNYGLSFESDISNSIYGVVGRLHGKDWPIGEPSGIKIIDGDTKVQNGKPENCIMTTSYIPDGYLDTDNPIPNSCSGAFQTHKRFKIDMLRTTYIEDGSYGHPIEITFNLKAGDTSTKRYQVFQKINNYTDKRLDGYKLEVFDSKGVKNPSLTLSLGVGEYVGTEDNRSDIWQIEELANMSHGLWGPLDDHFTEAGFFDDEYAYYPVTLSDDNTTISYIGEMQGGNYQEMFGNWLPSIWHPYGIFFDDDNNSATDAILLAFWGDPLKTGTNGWHKGAEDNWVLLSEEEVELWTEEGGAYEIAGIEDFLNLGLNYIINIGNNDDIGDRFTIRITPHFAPKEEQVEPAYVADSPLPNHEGSDRENPEDGKGSLGAYDNISLVVIFLAFLSLGAIFSREKYI